MRTLKALIMTAVLLGLAAGLAVPQTQDEAAAAYEKAKKLVYEKKWDQAVREFDAFKDKFKSSDYLDDGHYWLAYSLYKHSQSQGKLEDGLRLKQDALAVIDALLKKFDETSWEEDARALRVEIAEDLVRNGLTQFESYIDEEAEDADPEMEMKLVALNAMLGMNPEKAYPTLERILRESKNPKLREKAVFILSQYEFPKAAALMSELAAKDPDTGVRLQAIFWLGQREDDASLATLVKLFNASKDAEVRERIVFAIGQSGSPKAFDKLLELARSTKDKGMQEKAIFWLGQKNDERALKALVEIFDNTADDDIREKVIFALSLMERNPKAKAKLFDIARSDSDPKAQERALFWVGQRGGDDALSLLVEAYGTVQGVEARKKIIFSMGQINSDASVKKMIGLARAEKNVELKKHFIFWLGQSQNPEAVKFLEEIIGK